MDQRALPSAGLVLALNSGRVGGPVMGEEPAGKGKLAARETSTTGMTLDGGRMPRM